ncbi:MAG: hypothetical protein A2288_02030 [Candidatus Moranbacteria bacterium RIFOXYA12_FULL_44_15]|nr:MAG: hypothetical protein A2288_02030 [Candidatus Moranbacteria bacterium RIFOXYA12_FULL_44_15]OGI35910.1 MAG: hypothetical protein A2259_05015 [Candidatus Moranbacteria bacterium RIFOXYA2_FULL_43_15]
MFHLVKFLVSAIVIFFLAVFVLDYFGYEVNQSYFTESKKKCEEHLKECGKNLIREGTNNAECDFNCVDPKVIIKKK